MHFAALAITEERPTNEVLSLALAQFGPQHAGHWDWWTLGGRYTGNLIPIESENTVTGGPNVPYFEKRRAETGILVKRPEHTGPGVDAVPYKNLARLNTGFFPHALVFRGQWHECEVISLQSLARGAGLELNLSTRELEQEQAAVKRWWAKFAAIVEEVPLEHWISVIDCHS